MSAFEEAIIQRIKRLEREVERLQKWERPIGGGGGGVTDHGELTGLADDDHPQYLNNTRHDTTDRHTLGTVVPHDSQKADDSAVVHKTGNETVAGVKTFSSFPVTPSSAPISNYQVANKKYVDDNAGGGGVTDHGELTGLADDDHPQYLLRTDKAADSDKLDGVDITAFKGLNSLSDPNADRVLFWDDSAGALKWLTLGTGLTITDTTIKPSQPQFYPLTTPKTSTSWDGDSFSTTAKTKIDLSDVFGVPDGVKAILVRLTARDSGSSSGACQFALSPNNTADSVAAQAYLQGVANDVYVSENGVVPCDSGGDVYYQITASGTGTLDAFIEIWGYWL